VRRKVAEFTTIRRTFGRAVHPYDQITLEELRRRRSEKWRTYPPDVLPVWVAEMDFPLAAPIREALLDMVDRSDTGYPAVDGLPEAYARFAARRWGHAVDPGRILGLPDVMQGICAVLRVVSARGDEVVVHTPAYPPFFAGIADVERRFVAAPLAWDDDGRYEVDLDVLEACFREGARVYLLNNPHNPTGRNLSRAELEAIAGLCDRYGVRVLADEIHAPLVYPGTTFVPFASLDAESARRSVSLTAASKGWNLPGLKCAVAVAHDDDTWRAVASIPDEIQIGRSIFGVAATVAAFDEGEPWLDDTVAYLDGTRALLGDLLAERLPEVGYWTPEATYLAWLDCRSLAEAAEPSDVFLAKGRVATYQGPRFGPEGAGFVRFNFATPRPLVSEAIERMAAAVRP
jgi:cystathionine beta-lyase